VVTLTGQGHHPAVRPGQTPIETSRPSVRLTPAGPAPAPAASGTASSEDAPVLVVEDDPAIAELLVGAVAEHTGRDVFVAVDGRAALVLAAERPPSLVLLDLLLPGLDGYEVARRLKADPATAGAEIVALSAFGDRERALAAGCGSFLAKPFDVGALVLVVRVALARAEVRGSRPRPPRAVDSPEAAPSPGRRRWWWLPGR
jgi:DNA-binding response OmpR family regulator